MDTVTVNLRDRSYPIHIGARILPSIGALCRPLTLSGRGALTPPPGGAGGGRVKEPGGRGDRVRKAPAARARPPVSHRGPRGRSDRGSRRIRGCDGHARSPPGSGPYEPAGPGGQQRRGGGGRGG